MSLNNIEVRQSSRCPLTGSEGQPLRRRGGREIAASYRRHFGHVLPEELVETYFQSGIQEFVSSESNLRWFDPAPIAGEEFYQLMAATYPWYYTASTWDKHYACKMLQRYGIKNFLEVGCGDGIFLEMAASIDVSGSGIDTNTKALESVAAKGFVAGLPDSTQVASANPEALVMLQVLEHVPEPLDFVKFYVSQFDPRRLIVAVPCHETLLSEVTDPLAWPPHHVTMWSQKAFEALGEKIGYSLEHVAYPSMTYLRFVQLFNNEEGYSSPLGPLRRRENMRSGGADGVVDLAARGIRWFEKWDARLREQGRTDLLSKSIKKIYRDILRPFDEPDETVAIGPSFGRLKWLKQRLMHRDWACRDFWMLVVMERQG